MSFLSCFRRKLRIWGVFESHLCIGGRDWEQCEIYTPGQDGRGSCKSKRPSVENRHWHKNQASGNSSIITLQKIGVKYGNTGKLQAKTACLESEEQIPRLVGIARSLQSSLLLYVLEESGSNGKSKWMIYTDVRVAGCCKDKKGEVISELEGDRAEYEMLNTVLCSIFCCQFFVLYLSSVVLSLWRSHTSYLFILHLTVILSQCLCHTVSWRRHSRQGAESILHSCLPRLSQQLHSQTKIHIFEVLLKRGRILSLSCLKCILTLKRPKCNFKCNVFAICHAKLHSAV